MGHWEAQMNTQDTGTNGVTAPSSPLFASSWMALYSVLRDQFDSSRTPAVESGLQDSLDICEEPFEN